MRKVCNDTDTRQRYRYDTDTGIGLPTPIPIRGIADTTTWKKDNYYAFATAEEPLGPYLEVTEHTKDDLHNYYHVGVMLVLVFITRYDQYDVLFLRNRGKTVICCVAG